MFKIISQIVFLIIFLFLTIFVTVWFNDSEEDGTMTDNKQSISWLSESFKITGSVISAFLPKTETSSNLKNNDNMHEIGEANDSSSFATDIPGMYNNISGSASEYINNENGEENEFRSFVGDIVEKAPEYYLDVKLYNNAWQKFWSFYWLKYSETISE
ncbi:MAG: hypothetical protein PHE20_00025 [Patescibacteria group bacterium]|nr:hypothetical protein [Patescibacteria group bacterium]